jgi:very-short-patch-repair endonuclease
MTDAERFLWQRLRQRQLHDHKFRRQMPIGSYIADFVCLEARLIVELDGSQHQEQRDYDQQRDDWLQQQGFQILRFWNNDVFNHLEDVLAVILEKLSSAIALSPHPNPPPQGGRESE